MARINKLFLALAVLVVFGFAAVPAAKADACTVAGNLVTNCGFETGTFAGWTQSGNSGFTGIEAGGHSGSFDAFFGPVGSQGFISQNLATVAGGTYSLSFWLQNGGGAPSQFTASFNGVTVVNLIDSPAFGYTLFTINGLVATGPSTQLQFGFRQDPGFFLFDDVIVVPQGAAVPEPMSLLLLGSGLAGVAAKLRRRKVV